MKAFALGSALAVVCYVSMPAVAVAKGSGGGHGGGHAASGHASGGHASGGHAGGQSQGSTAAPGGAVAGGAGTSAANSASQPTTGHPRDGRPLLGTAVPRTGTTPSSPGTLPSYSLYGFRPFHGSAFGVGGLGLYSSYDPFWSSFMYGFPAYAYAPAPTWSVPGYSAPYGYIPDPFDAERITGGLRLMVEPKEAQVYVDGYRSEERRVGKECRL